MSMPSATFDPDRTPVRAPSLRIAARVGVAVLGGYAFTWGLVALATALLFKVGMGFHDAEFLSTAIGLLVFLVALLWTIATPRLVLAALLLVGGGALMAAAASLVQSTLV